MKQVFTLLWTLVFAIIVLSIFAYGETTSENSESPIVAMQSEDYAHRGTDKVISGYGHGEVLLTFMIKTALPTFSGAYNLDIIGINIPPISTSMNITRPRSKKVQENDGLPHPIGYAFETEGIYLPIQPNNFTVSAHGVKGMNIGVKKTAGTVLPREGYSGHPFSRVWVSQQINADSNGDATIENSLISPGQYHFKIFGAARDNTSSVELDMVLVKKAIINGNFNLSINTTGFPAGSYSVKAQTLNGSLSLDDLAVEDISIRN